jgi:hypothetical protein
LERAAIAVGKNGHAKLARSVASKQSIGRACFERDWLARNRRGRQRLGRDGAR